MLSLTSGMLNYFLRNRNSTSECILVLGLQYLPNLASLYQTHQKEASSRIENK